MLQLTVAFGAGADHGGHDRADDRLSSDWRSRLGLFTEGARGIGMALQAPVGDHDAFSDCLFG